MQSNVAPFGWTKRGRRYYIYDLERGAIVKDERSFTTKKAVIKLAELYNSRLVKVM